VYALSNISGGYNGSLSIAAGFTNSTEFISKYGSLTNAQFVTDLYSNILDRALTRPDTMAGCRCSPRETAGSTSSLDLLIQARPLQMLRKVTLVKADTMRHGCF
jgi:hypothetical protein